MSDYEIVRSPLNYSVGRYWQVPFILDHLPKFMRIFRDMFINGGNVYANVWPHKNVSEIHVYSRDAGLIAQLLAMGYQDPIQFVKEVRAEIKTQKLGPTSKKAYYAYRDKLNKKEIPLNAVRFMALIAHGHKNTISWNPKGDFKTPFGKRTFNAKMRDHTFAFVGRLNQIPNLTYFPRDFRLSRTRQLTPDDLVFAAPPPLGRYWSTKDLHDVFCKLDVIAARGVRFMYLGAAEHTPKDWANRYTLLYVDAAYQLRGSTQVLVINYEPK